MKLATAPVNWNKTMPFDLALRSELSLRLVVAAIPYAGEIGGVSSTWAEVPNEGIGWVTARSALRARLVRRVLLRSQALCRAANDGR